MREILFIFSITVRHLWTPFAIDERGSSLFFFFLIGLGPLKKSKVNEAFCMLSRKEGKKKRTHKHTQARTFLKCEDYPWQRGHNNQIDDYYCDHITKRQPPLLPLFCDQILKQMGKQ